MNRTLTLLALGAALAAPAAPQTLESAAVGARARLAVFAASRASRKEAVRRPGAAACPEAPASKDWVEEAGAPPRAVARRHIAAPGADAVPLLVPIQAASYWIGMSWRSGEPSCFLSGSVAYYFNGPEDEPQVDFVKAVRAGGEAGLAERLVELRWYDPADGRRHRWFNIPLAARLGLLTDPRGREDPSARPLPLAQAVNSLY